MFYDRIESGEKLAKKITQYKDKKNTVILALSKGGLVVGKAISSKLNLSLGLLSVKKIYSPINSNLIIGAFAETGEPIINDQLIGTDGISPDYLDREISSLKEKIKNSNINQKLIKKNDVSSQSIIIVDDGINSIYPVMATISYLKTQKVQEIVIATPVINSEIIFKLKNKVNHIYYIYSSTEPFTVDQFYEESFLETN